MSHCRLHTLQRCVSPCYNDDRSEDDGKFVFQPCDTRKGEVKMDILKNKVKELETQTDHEAIVKSLQEIGKLLLTDYVVQVDDVTVEPLWVEAYYYNQNCFPDPFVHGRPEQKEYDILYFHHSTDDQRNGVDLCLSLGDYYLSFLLKYTTVNGQLKSQSELSPLIRKKYADQKGGVLMQRTNPTDALSFTTRIGLSDSKEKNAEIKQLKSIFKSEKLSVVRDFNKQFVTVLRLPKRESLVREYLAEQKEWSQAEKAEFCIKTLGYCLGEYKPSKK